MIMAGTHVARLPGEIEVSFKIRLRKVRVLLDIVQLLEICLLGGRSEGCV